MEEGARGNVVQRVEGLGWSGLFIVTVEGGKSIVVPHWQSSGGQLSVDGGYTDHDNHGKRPRIKGMARKSRRGGERKKRSGKGNMTAQSVP